MNDENVEIRGYGAEDMLHDNDMVAGYGALFNHRSTKIGGRFYEVIKPNAITDEVIKRSDVFCRFNHEENKILARSNKGEGSLKLSLDDKGLSYSFKIPKTEHGNELRSALERKEITESSFAFTVAKDSWSRAEDGTPLRTIEQIDALFDVSPVYRAAYSETYVGIAMRSLDKFEEEERKVSEQKEEIVEERNEEPKVEEHEEKEVQQPIEEREQKIDININLIQKKMGNFSLINAINSIANNKSVDERAQEVINAGAEEMRKSGVAFGGQIQLPMEFRDDTATIQAGVATLGKEAIPTDTLDILQPLRAKLVMVQAGATYMTNLSGNVSIPVYSGSNCTWEGETASAKNGKGAFSDVKLEPKRLTAYIDVSKQFLTQASPSAEAMLKNDIINAVASKLESTILGNAAGSTTQPAGLFYGVTADTAAASYKDIVAMEAALENANVSGDIKFIVSPSAKADLKTTELSSNTARYLMEGNEMIGYPVLTTCGVAGKGVIMGNFSDYVIGQWGSLDLTIDPYSLSANAKIRIVINGYFDAKPRRANAFVKKVLYTAA